ncbi:hypothetical protein [Flaviaesturariibacter amylovorans]|uniref:Uncharacterized protein n=1 Tax=Flaviaesturariibacter amylovorans TaxID=1084520 RepID=A0ABP8HUC1_9BACT
MARFVFLILVLCASAGLAEAQRSLIAGTYVALIRDDIGYDNCCTLNEVLQLDTAGRFRYYRLNDQGDYSTEHLTTGRYVAGAHELRFEPDSTKRPKPWFPNDPMDAPFHDTLLRTGTPHLRSKGPVQFIGGGSNEVVTWYRINWQQLDSLHLHYMIAGDSTGGSKLLFFTRGKPLVFSYSLSRYYIRDSAGHAATVQGTDEIRMTPAREQELIRRLEAGPVFETPLDPESLYNPAFSLSIYAGGQVIKAHGSYLSPALAAWLLGPLLAGERIAHREAAWWGYPRVPHAKR